MIPIALEIGRKRIFASALDWPGWTRAGRTEEEALEALVSYAPRYKKVVTGFKAPSKEFKVVERLKGNATTDFGAPGAIPSFDVKPMDANELKRSKAILAACWAAFGASSKSAKGKPLALGPRGGGRPLEKIAEHVTGAHRSYLRMILWRENAIDDAKALEFATSEKMPSAGPRGGALWPPRYFVRRAAWHLLDHAWEIEDRKA